MFWQCSAAAAGPCYRTRLSKLGEMADSNGRWRTLSSKIWLVNRVFRANARAFAG